MPIISVIVPCYNQAQYLDECLQSVLAQTHQNWECIIVNDGSPDNTEEVVEKWCARDSRFRYFHKENSGVSAARNYGIRKAKSKYIIALDSDDKLGINYLQFCCTAMIDGADLAYTDANYFGEKKGEFVLPDFRKESFLRYNCIYNAAMFKKKLWEVVNGYDEEMLKGLEDWEFWIRYIFNNDAIITRIPSFEFFYRIKDSSRNQTVESNYARARSLKEYIIFKNVELYFDFYNHPKNFFFKILIWRTLKKMGIKWNKKVL